MSCGACVKGTVCTTGICRALLSLLRQPPSAPMLLLLLMMMMTRMRKMPASSQGGPSLNTPRRTQL
jgi:hypothetical protein